MRKYLLIAVVVFGLGIIGCALLDPLFGGQPPTPNPDGSPPPDGGAPRFPDQPSGPNTPIGAVAGILSIWLPWASAAAGALGGIYAAIRRRQYYRALNSVARGINVARESHAVEGRIDIPKLMGTLAAEQDKDHVRDLIRDVVHRLEGKK